MNYDYFVDIEEDITQKDIQKVNSENSIDNTSYKPPSRYGLSNSEPIIPTYYIKYIDTIMNNKDVKIPYINVEYLTIIKDDIKNYRKLNQYQISHVKTKLSDEDKNNIIDLLLNVNAILIDLLY